jgi:hypothetical protein
MRSPDGFIIDGNYYRRSVPGCKGCVMAVDFRGHPMFQATGTSDDSLTGLILKFIEAPHK